MDIGNTIRELRKSQGLNQFELARLSQITQTALSQIENNKKHPTQQTLAKIADSLYITPAAIYVMSIDRNDVPECNRSHYDVVFPVIKEKLLKLFVAQ